MKLILKSFFFSRCIYFLSFPQLCIQYVYIWVTIKYVSGEGKKRRSRRPINIVDPRALTHTQRVYNTSNNSHAAFCTVGAYTKWRPSESCSSRKVVVEGGSEAILKHCGIFQRDLHRPTVGSTDREKERRRREAIWWAGGEEGAGREGWEEGGTAALQ